jgi:NTP pyrophosphatase (non-canonical NTP hydrolase)
MENQNAEVQVRDMDQYVTDARRTEPDYAPVVQRLADPRVARLLHVAMGLVTEAGEFVDQLKRHLFYGKPLDTVNLLEELGDITWYQRLGVDELESSLIDILDRNVAKLRARFPEKFTEDAALNRDLDAERKVLEGPPMDEPPECQLCGRVCLYYPCPHCGYPGDAAVKGAQ